VGRILTEGGLRTGYRGEYLIKPKREEVTRGWRKLCDEVHNPFLTRYY
jgi:hypothetical protein